MLPELSEGYNLSPKDLIKDKPNLFILRAFTKDYASPACAWDTAFAAIRSC